MDQAQLTDKQSSILQAIWMTFEAEGNTVDERNRLNAEYDDTVVELLKLLGDRAPASQIDMGEYETFSNCFKSVNGVRPRGYTYYSMVEWMDNRRLAA